MNGRITLTFSLDDDYIAAQAVKSGRPADVIARELVAQLECVAFDCLRWRDGVDNLGVKSDTTQARERRV